MQKSKQQNPTYIGVCFVQVPAVSPYVYLILSIYLIDWRSSHTQYEMQN